MVRHVVWTALVASLLGLTGIRAYAEPADDPCRVEGHETECYLKHQTAYLNLYGLSSAESHLAAREEIIRAMYTDGYGRDVLAIQLSRVTGREPTLTIHQPGTSTPQAPASPALSVAVPLAAWNDLIDRAAHFDRIMEPVRVERAPPGHDDETITLCLHAWYYIVEATKPGAAEPHERLRRRVESSCADGLTQQFAHAFAETAVRLIPACGVLDRAQHRNAEMVLATCATLRGDRIAAAEVRNRAEELARLDLEDEPHLVSRYFVPRASLEWADEVQDASSGSATERWIAGLLGSNGGRFFPGGAYGESASRVRIEGGLQRWTEDEEPVLLRAPVEQIWVADEGGAFRIERANVGSFERIEGFCPPGTLTGATHCRF